MVALLPFSSSQKQTRNDREWQESCHLLPSLPSSLAVISTSPVPDRKAFPQCISKAALVGILGITAAVLSSLFCMEELLF